MSPHILRMLDGIFSLDAAHISLYIIKLWAPLVAVFVSVQLRERFQAVLSLRQTKRAQNVETNRSNVTSTSWMLFQLCVPAG